MRFSGAQTISLTIKVEEPIFLTIQAGNVDGYQAEINDLRAELSSLHRQLKDSHAQLADHGGVLRTTQEQLAQSHGALSIERQRPVDLAREMRGRSLSPIPGAGNSAASDSEELSGTSRSWTDKEGLGSRAAFANAGHSGLDRSAAVGLVRCLPTVTLTSAELLHLDRLK